jgi:NAD(P)-dependent dehydrogenase (short-subunit alcohol dehydrogenase family)
MKTFPHLNESARGGNKRFEGRTVLVIGGGQASSGAGEANEAGAPIETIEPVGNGRAICLQLAAGGARVLCADRSADAAARTVADIAASDVAGKDGSALALTADISRAEDIRALFDGLAQRGIAIDGLVLNAGISDRKSLRDITPESWDTIFGVNLRGHALCAQAALPAMNHGGAIVFVSSLAAEMPAGRNPAYESSKAGLSALCRATALEAHEKDIRANLVRAGLIDTPMGRAASAARPGRAAGPLPFGRQGTAWDIAHAVCFLLSDEAAYINAAELAVDGGLRHGIARAAPPASS